MSSELALKTQLVQESKWKRYPAYRDSGVEWIGEVPEHWNIERLKYCATLINEKVDGRESILPYTGLENIESWTGQLISREEVSTSEGQSNRFEIGDVLFGKLRPYLAKVLRAKEHGICTGELLVLRPKDVSQDYLFRYMLARDFISIVDSSTYGAKMPRASWDFIGDLSVLLPTEAEQRAIAAFLDRETGRIDTLIEKKERQIELLQEKRAALISHAVTKGLNPDVKMKDSGVEWLGEIPEEWKLKRIKHIASKIGSGKTPKGGSEVYSESGVTFLRSQNIHFDGLRLDDAVFITESIDEDMFSTKVFSNDVLLNITGASLGRCSLVPDDFPSANVNQHVCIVRPIKKSIVPLFLYNAFASKVVQAQIFSWENGSSREGLTFPQIANLVIVAPDDLEEQHSIAAFLDRETEHIDTLTTKVRESISKLREYRIALISAAVTGKIDVRMDLVS